MIAFSILAILLYGFADPAQKKGWLSYEPAVVELKGTLTVKRYFGPPHYGENPKTDAKETVPILILNKPINVQGNPDPQTIINRDSVKGARKIQLILHAPYKKFLGKTVLVKGTLFHAHTGHHRTDVLMDVRSIEVLSHK